MSGPFILLTPRVEAITTDLRALVLSKGGQLSGLGGILEVDDQGRLAPTNSLESILWPSAPLAKDEGLPEAMIRRVGRDWEITYESKAIVLPNLLGVRYLVELLRCRQEPITARELYAAVKGADLQTLYADGLSQDRDMESDREALHRLRADRAKAESEGDSVWLKEIDESVRSLGKKLASQKDRRGRKRPDDQGEKCRKAVSKAVHRVLEEIEGVHPELFEHLKAVSLGFKCWYHPQKPVNWQFR